MKTSPPARLHLLPAKAAPFTVVLRRKPTDWFHVLRWNTQSDHIEHGSWFQGTLYPKRADVSFDGEWMVLLAMVRGDTFNLISRPPLLTPVIQSGATGTYRGGGYWESESLLRLNGWDAMGEEYPRFKAAMPSPFVAYEDELGDLGVLYRRLQRDGWSRFGANWGEETRVGRKHVTYACVGDDGWKNQPTPDHPTLRMAYTGFRLGNLQFRFWLAELPDLIPAHADWACWDCLGQLLFSCAGSLYRFGINDIRAGRPATVIDLEHLTPPVSG